MEEKEIVKFIESRKKMVKVATPFILLLIMGLVVVYVFVFINFPEVCRMEKGGTGNTFRNLTPVFFNLFMMSIFMVYAVMLICLKKEMEYIKIVEKFLRGKSPSQGT